MKLKEFVVRNFRSIWDSNTIEVDDRITCLVGKNESGKTALLNALYKTNPIVPAALGFDPTYDYPKREVSNYLESDTSKHSQAVEVHYTLENQDQEAVTAIFGPHSLNAQTLIHKVHYGDRDAELVLDLNHGEAVRYLAQSEALSDAIRQDLQSATGWREFLSRLDAAEATEAVNSLKARLERFQSDDLSATVAKTLLWSRCPTFMYFDEYHQLEGRANIEALIQRKNTNALKPSDHPLLGLINLARLHLGELSSVVSTTDLKNKLQGAGNHLTQQVLTHWSQNKHIQMMFDVRDAKPEDPEEMRRGVNIWGEVYDTVHMASTPLESRSRGFVWFFSFLAWYEDIKRKGQDLILLLDEPGLSLHGRAQGDLLRFFESQLADHQIIYTTHSPFMVDPRRLDRVRIVQDLGIDSERGLPRDEDGTKVHTDLFNATPDSLFPLQGALGYDIQQTLLIGPNTLLVECPSDVLYLQTLSDQLERDGKTFLSRDWTLVPVGGIGKVPVFAALLNFQEGMTVAALLDVTSKDKQAVERIYQKKLLAKRSVLTYADFIEQDDADVEDIFEVEFYVHLVNKEYEHDLSAEIDADSLGEFSRIVPAITRHLKKDGLLNKPFNHYRPARYFMENAASLWGQVSEDTQSRVMKMFGKLNDLLR